MTDSQGGPDLLGPASAATSVKYRINGQPAEPADPLSSETRSLSIAPNLTVTALKSGTADLTVAQSTGAISGAIASFVQSYNAATKSLDAHRGTGGRPWRDRASSATSRNRCVASQATPAAARSLPFPLLA